MILYGEISKGDHKGNLVILAQFKAATLNDLQPEDSRQISDYREGHSCLVLRNELKNVLWRWQDDTVFLDFGGGD